MQIVFYARYQSILNGFPKLDTTLVPIFDKRAAFAGPS
jgi:hypothetical protein